MKYILGILAGVLISTGIFYWFNMGENGSLSNDSSNNGNTLDSMSSSSAKILDLRNKGLSEVSSDIYSRTETTELILSSNSIRTLPSEMGKMTDLIIFKIDHNILDGSLIGEIRQMSKLKTLVVSYNNMTGMPAEIGQLNNLETLDYSYNKIEGLPNELANLKNNLKELNLTGNPLTQDKINKLKSDLPNTNIIF